LETIKKQLELGWVRYEDTVTSTNDLAAAWVAEGAPHLSLIAADHQTKGRGRGGRKWFTPPNSALAFSLILRIDKQIEGMQRFSGLGAMAVCQTLQVNYQQKAQIKWPNDVLLKGKKVCGVLPEAIWIGDKVEAVILGVGVNLTAAAYPKDIPLLYPAISVEEAVGKPIQDDQFLLAVLANLKIWFKRIENPEFITTWDDNLAFKGEDVEILQAEKERTIGQLVGLDTTGRIVLATQDKGEVSFSASEIHLRPFVDTSRK
jgi:BirA family biotin operon repressor/biotin-[acetyl-CoA-carboxylase] ligase